MLLASISICSGSAPLLPGVSLQASLKCASPHCLHPIFAGLPQQNQRQIFQNSGDMSAFERKAVGSRGGGFGLDAELARKREAQYDHKAEDEARVCHTLSHTATHSSTPLDSRPWCLAGRSRVDTLLSVSIREQTLKRWSVSFRLMLSF